MTFADPIGDMITRIRNAQLRTLYNVLSCAFLILVIMSPIGSTKVILPPYNLPA